MTFVLRALSATMLAIAVAISAHAQPIKPDNPADASRYAACMAMAQKSPQQAINDSKAWAASGGGEPAQHCAAMAYLGLGLYSEAALRLETLADSSKAQQGRLRADLYSQAGQAWLIAGKPDQALAVQTRALKLRPNDVELLIDRSITLATSEKLWEAVDDLNRALEIAPDRADALVFRASAYRSLDTLDLAEADIEQANRLWPDSPEVILERGSIRKARSNPAGARADWMRVIELAPNSPAGEQARRALQVLDVKPDSGAPRRTR
jgi:tetratricopeptide (TPR) repeat protein